MSEAGDVLEDHLDNCFEPREPNMSFSEVTLFHRNDSNEEKASTSVSVCSPEKYSTFTETYVRYKVITESSREEFKNTSHQVYRRYNDFLWLRDRLEESNPTLVIPPFPPKHSINSIDRFNGPFIMARCKALNTFINRVCRHPMLSSSDDLFHFLTCLDDRAWLNHKRVHNSSGFDLTNKLKSIVQTGETSPEFADSIPKLDRCREACESIISVSQLKEEEERSLARELTQLANGMSNWSSESGHIPQIGSLLYQIGQVFEYQAQDLLSTSHCLTTKLVPEVTDLIAYSQCVKRVATRRDKLQGYIRDVGESAANIERSMDTPSTLSRKIRRESVEEERYRRESNLSQLRSRSESLTSSLETADADLRTESGRWTAHRNAAVRMALLDFAGLRLAHHRRMDQQWHRLSDQTSEASGDEHN